MYTCGECTRLYICTFLSDFTALHATHKANLIKTPLHPMSIYPIGGVVNSYQLTSLNLLIGHVQPKPEYERELLSLKDGGTVGIDWLASPFRHDVNTPIVILQHGLCGHTYSHYMKGQPEVLTQAGLYVASFVARGCGGVPLTTPETFTASRTNDFREVVQYISKTYPGRKIAAVGYSLGAGLLLKYLGEEGENCIISAAVAISPAYDFHDRTHLFTKYERMGMVNGLINLVKNHEGFLKNHPDSCLDWNGMMNCRTVREFDQAAIVGKPPNEGSNRVGMDAYGTSSPDKLTGNRHKRDFLHFATVDDYYTASSSKHYIQCITIPTLAISSKDDFLSAHTSVPTKSELIGTGMCVLMTPHGGHVSFSDCFGNAYGPASCWSDRVSAAWIKSCTITVPVAEEIKV